MRDKITLPALRKRAWRSGRTTIKSVRAVLRDYGDNFAHPYVQIEWSCGHLTNVTFQQHRLSADDSSGWSYADSWVPSRGFLDPSALPQRRWSSCYAATLSGGVDGEYERGRITRALSLLKAADDAIEASPVRRQRCDLLRLIAGLQRIGLAVEIDNPAVIERLKRARRDRDVGPEYAIAV